MRSGAPCWSTQSNWSRVRVRCWRPYERAIKSSAERPRVISILQDSRSACVHERIPPLPAALTRVSRSIGFCPVRSMMCWGATAVSEAWITRARVVAKICRKSKNFCDKFGDKPGPLASLQDPARACRLCSRLHRRSEPHASAHRAYGQGHSMDTRMGRARPRASRPDALQIERLSPTAPCQL